MGGGGGFSYQKPRGYILRLSNLRFPIKKTRGYILLRIENLSFRQIERVHEAGCAEDIYCLSNLQ